MFKIFILIMGILPSVIWLLFYLRKDKHPEPNKMVLLVFFLGMIAVPVAAIIENYASIYVGKLPIKPLIQTTLQIFIVIALTEEILKYLGVRLISLKNPEFDEPIDVMLYLIIVALGFAAAENILTLYRLSVVNDIIITSILRFWGATFLHTLASGMTGYYLALSMRKSGIHSKLLVVYGIIIATAIHGAYNYILFLFTLSQLPNNNYYLFVPMLTLMIVSAMLIFRQIKMLKKKLSICDI